MGGQAFHVDRFGPIVTIVGRIVGDSDRTHTADKSLHVDVQPKVKEPAFWLDRSQLWTPFAPSSHSLPALQIDPEYGTRPGCQINEAAVMADFAITKEAGQQRQRVLREGRIDEGRLAL